MRDCACPPFPGSPIAESADFLEGRNRTIPVWMAHRIMINRIPSSMSEKPQISIEPKAKGVKRIKAMRRILITLLIIAYSVIGHWVT
jgi:hypothetical protein